MAEKGKKRLSIPGLVPGEEYVIQVRAIDEGEPSQWSVKEKVTTIDDTAGGTRKPVTMVLNTWTLNAEGMFSATWNTVNAYTDGTAMHVDHYEIELSSAYGVWKTGHYGTAEGVQQRDFTLAQIKAMHGGILPSSVSARVLVVASGGAAGEWSNQLTAELPVPYPPTNPSGLPVVDGIKVMWQPPVEPYVPGDPRWPAGYRVYMAMDNPDFVPDGLQKSNMIYQGQSLEAAMTSMSYEKDHWFKICSYSPADLQSEFITAGPLRPISPYGPDEEPPSVPQNVTATMNADRSVSGQATITWTMAGDGLPPEGVPQENRDITGFVVAWRLAGEQINGQDVWRNTYFAKDVRSGVIDLPRAFANYEFKVAAYDFVANYSDFSLTVLLEGAGDPPTALTGLNSVPRWDGVKLLWDHSNSPAVTNGGRYEIQFRTTTPITGDTPIDYITGGRELDIAGLNVPQGTYYWRARAVDVMGRTGPWSATQTTTLPAFPTASTSDNIPPSAAPQNVKVTGGLNYLNVAWDRVSNTDPVTYEVYLSPTNNFTPSAATFAGSTPATSLMVNSVPGAGALQQNTVYYVRVVATDADTDEESDKIYSNQVSGQLTQIAGGDLGINMSGENLLYNTSFETDSNGDALADYWAVYNNSPTTEPTQTYMYNTGRTGGKCQRVTWTGVNTTQKGIYPINQPVSRPNTEYVVSFYARASAGTGFNLTFNANTIVNGSLVPLFNPPPATNDWKRYAFKFVSSGTPETNNFHITIVGNSQNGGWVEFDDIQMEAGSVASAYKIGTVSIAKLASGKMETAIMTIAAGGQIVSSDYDFAAKKGFLITGTGINLLGGTVNAAVLAANSTITQKLFVGADLELATGGKFFSTNYRAKGTNGATDPGAGFRMDSVGLDIRSGTVAAGALAAGTITTPDLRIGSGGKLTVDANGSIQSNNYVYGSSGFKIHNGGIEMWDQNSSINVAALKSGILSGTNIVVGSGGQVISSNWSDVNKTGYRLNESGFTLYNGTITGSTIRTNQIYSQTQVGGRYTFSINTDGYAEFTGALIYGNARMGSAATDVIQSGTWNGSTTGWQIRGDGWAQFFHVNTWNLNVYSSAKVGGDSSHSISSSNFSYSAAGWIIRGDGYAEFNAGRLVVGYWDGGSAQLMFDGWGNGQLRFYSPQRTDAFHHLRSNGTMFEARGGWGGAVEIYPNGGGGSEVRLLNNARVTQHLTVDNQCLVGGELHVGGGVKLAAYGGTNGERYVTIGNAGWLGRGGSTSSIQIKKNIAPLDTDWRNILALEPKSFDYRADPEGTKRSVGFIVEEARDLGLHDYVDYNEEGQPVAFDYPFFVTALQKVNREQQKMIDNLLSRIEALEAGS